MVVRLEFNMKALPVKTPNVRGNDIREKLRCRDISSRNRRRPRAGELSIAPNRSKTEGTSRICCDKQIGQRADRGHAEKVNSKTSNHQGYRKAHNRSIMRHKNERLGGTIFNNMMKGTNQRPQLFACTPSLRSPLPEKLLSGE